MTVFGLMASRTTAGMPISATVTRPHFDRPGNSKWPGLRRKNVTVSSALIATPMSAPVEPLMPLGRSTATTLALCTLIAWIRSCASPVMSRSRPAPNNASTMTCGAREKIGARCLGRTFPVLRRLQRVAFQTIAVAEKQHANRIAALRTAGARRQNHRRHCCRGLRRPRSWCRADGARRRGRRPPVRHSPSTSRWVHRRRPQAGRPLPFRCSTTTQSSGTQPRLPRSASRQRLKVGHLCWLVSRQTAQL